MKPGLFSAAARAVTLLWVLVVAVPASAAEPAGVNLEMMRAAGRILVPLVVVLVGAAISWWVLSRRVEARTRLLRNELAERQRVDEALRESESRFRALADIVPFGIIIFQQERIVYANRAAGELHGSGAAELLGVSPRELVHPDHVELFR